MLEKLYKYTSPVFYIGLVVLAIAWTLSYIGRYTITPIKSILEYHFIVKKYSNDECKTAYRNLDRWCKGKPEKLNWHMRWAYEYCEDRLKTIMTEKDFLEFKLKIIVNR